MPESELRQPSAKAGFWICEELVGGVRRNEHHVSCRELELNAVLKRFSASIDDISHKRRDHAPWLGLRAGPPLQQTAGEHARRRTRLAAKRAHVSERKLACGEHRRLDYARQDVDALLLAFLFNEAR